MIDFDIQKEVHSFLDVLTFGILVREGGIENPSPGLAC